MITKLLEGNFGGCGYYIKAIEEGRQLKATEEVGAFIEMSQLTVS